MGKLSIISAAATMALAVSTAAVMAPPTVTVNSVTAKWGPVTGGSNVNYVPAGGGDPAEVRWGTGGVQSGYKSQSNAPTGNHSSDDVFDLGTFTHFNQPIDSGTSITKAVLTLTFNVTFGGGGASEIFDSVYNFEHWETDNRPQGGFCANGQVNNYGVNGNGCADRVRPTQKLAQSKEFEFEDGTYYMTITGFLLEGNDVSEFWTKEETNNHATIRASFTHTPNVIPLPAAAWLLIGGLGCLGAAARRRSSKAPV